MAKVANEMIDKDHILQSLVDATNKNTGTVAIGITLLTHGFLVSGLLVSGQEYMQGFLDELGSVFNDVNSDLTSGVKEIIANSKESFNKITKTKESNLPFFIHIKDARFFHTNGNPVASNQGKWWRGRLSEISGFSPGIIELSKES